jgi:hypothetical protein
MKIFPEFESGHPDRIGESVDAMQHPLACIGA